MEFNWWEMVDNSGYCMFEWSKGNWLSYNFMIAGTS